jgi:4-diphosphocytidyl-2-C-methyl-D-erythritol kinase
LTARAIFDVPAPAKINRFLHVIGRRSDGYHLLQSVFQLVDWCDTLHFECRNDGLIRRTDIGPAMPADDLCVRAARALQLATGTSAGVDIVLDKTIPWGAGLGGGSSDAASTLLALNRLWQLGLTNERLRAIAAGLGADLPFFVAGSNAFVEGIGERLTPVTLPREWFAIVKPAAAIATADIFSSPLVVRNSSPAILEDFLAEYQTPRQDGNQGSDFGRNDLQSAAEQMLPEVSAVANWLQGRLGNSRMSGSGSAVFARAGNGDQALATGLATRLEDALPKGWVGRFCRSLDKHPLAGWSD